jgi:beta-lactam-binding protein with PASTA domain
MSLNAARLRLIAAGVRPGRVDSIASGDARPGTVVAQGPAPGTTVIPGYAVRITLARAEVVAVPDLSGATMATARARLEEARLTVGAVDSTESERSAGTVIAQQPAAGTTVAPGAAVAVSLAASRLVAVPDVAGQPLARATATLRNAGLRVGEVDTATARGEPSSVLRQTVAAGERVKPGTSVGLVVARGTVRVPDLAGRTPAEAATLLRQANLSRGAVDSLASERPVGTVVRQAPAAGAEVAPGSTVALTLAQARLVAVPNVVGGSAAEAARALAAAGLRAGSVDSVRNTAAAATVVRQSIAAGTRVRPGTALDLAVSRGPQVAVVPPAGGQDPAPPVTDPVAGPTQPAAPVTDPVAGTPQQPVPPVTDPAVASGGATPDATAPATPGGAGFQPGGTADPAPSAGNEGGGFQWWWIVVAAVVVGAVAMAMRGRGGASAPAPAPAPSPAPVAATVPVPVPVFRTSGAWDPGSADVATEGRLVGEWEATLGGWMDVGVQTLQLEGALTTAEEEA